MQASNFDSLQARANTRFGVAARIVVLLAGLMIAGPVTAQYSFTVLRSFGPTNQPGDGANPTGGLRMGSDGVLYGTTQGGGASNAGTIFRLNQDGSGYSVLWSFLGAPQDGSNTIAKPSEGSDGFLYGTTQAGGSNNLGTVFKISKNGTGYAVLHHFRGAPADGSGPYHSVIEGSDGVLYGSTYYGGTNGVGAIFKVNKDGGGYAVIRNFSAADGGGVNPWASLSEASDGLLYGLSYTGGTNGGGTLFRLQRNGSGFAVLHSFGSSGDGANSTTRLFEARDGALYGTTLYGGAGMGGTVFTLHRDGSAYRVLHAFSGSGAGSQPGNGDGGLLEAIDGFLYGTTVLGGTNSAGTVFRLRRDGSDYSIVHTFASNEGASPHGGVVPGSNDTLYGSAASGGEQGLGSAFRIPVPPTPLTLLQSPVSQIVSAGSNLLFSALSVSSFPPISYQWQAHGSNILGANGPSLTLSNVQPIDGGDYIITMGDSAGSSVSVTSTLNVVLGPVLLEQPHSQTVAQNTTISFAVGAISGSPPIAYEWRFNGSAIAGATNSSLNFTSVQQTNAGDYSVLVSDTRGSVTSSVAKLTFYNNSVWRFMSVTGNIGATSNSIGTNVLIHLAAAGEAYIDDVSFVPLSGPLAGSNVLQNGNFEAPLSGPWTVLPGMSGSSLSSVYAHSGSNSLHVVAANPGSLNNNIKQLLPASTTNILVTLSFWYYAFGNSTLYVRAFPGSLVTNVSVQPVDLRPSFAFQPTNIAVPMGGGATFEVSAFGSEPLDYHWLKDGAILADGGRISGSTTPHLSLSNVGTLDLGSYSVMVTNLIGSSNSSPAMLTVMEPPHSLLSIARHGTNIYLSWPATPVPGVLENTAILGDYGEWTPSGFSPSNAGDNLIVTIPLTASNRFFRVRN